jgi:diguanylate cyclase
LSKDEERVRAEEHARDALAWIAQHGVTPSPESFEVAFNHVTARHAELKRNIESLLHSGGKIDDYIVTLLHHRYFRSPKMDSAIASVGEALSKKLDSALQMLEEGGRDQSVFGQELGAAANALGTARRDETGIEVVVKRVLETVHRMKARTQMLEERLQKSSQDVSALREQLEVTRRESLTDPLTGIANRKAFDLAIEREIDASIESGEPLSLIVCDIDHFKRFNDRWGHEIGDQVLRAVATCLSKNVKGRDVAARIGGEEFAVILPKTNLNEAAILAHHIRNDLAEKKLIKRSTGAELSRVTLSAGVAQYALSDTVADLLRRADLCLYAAKHAGRNEVVSEIDSKRLKAASAHAA